MSDRMSNEHDHDLADKLEVPGEMPAGEMPPGADDIGAPPIDEPDPRAVPANEGGQAPD
jgi:hypothetical protein